MALSERHQKIIDILKLNGVVSVNELSKMLNVSSVTIRKDLSLLEEKQMLFRTHGSAIQKDPYALDQHVKEKEKQHPEVKQAIALKAKELIRPQDAIIIASGTTVLALARAISGESQLTVLTSAMNVASALIRDKGIEVIQLGGVVRQSSTSVVGEYAEKMLENFSCSKLYLGVDGIDLDYGLTTTNYMEASLNRAMIKAAQKTIVLTDSSKFGRRGFGKICDFEAIDQIITDNLVSPKIVEELQKLGIEVTLVDAEDLQQV
ncbi:MAG: transcriptional repressor AgaR [Marinifilaceae bacterium]